MDMEQWITEVVNQVLARVNLPPDDPTETGPGKKLLILGGGAADQGLPAAVAQGLEAEYEVEYAAADRAVGPADAYAAIILCGAAKTRLGGQPAAPAAADAGETACITKKVLTEKDLVELKSKRLAAVRVEKGCIITDLAREFARKNNILIDKR